MKPVIPVLSLLLAVAAAVMFMLLYFAGQVRDHPKPLPVSPPSAGARQ